MTGLVDLFHIRFLGKKMKKLVFLLVTLFAACFSVIAGGQGLDYLNMPWEELVTEAKKEGSVNLYIWYAETHWVPACEEFEKEYGIKAKVIIGDSVANINKVVSEKDKKVGTVDVMNVGGQMVKTIMDIGLVLGPMKGRIAHADKLSPLLWESQEGYLTRGYLVPINRNQTGFVYDPERVDKSELPQTWEELNAWIIAHPKQFGFCDPSKGGSGQAFVHTIINQVCGGLDKYRGDTKVVPEKVANWNFAWEWANSVEDYVTFTASNNDSLVRLNDGELSLVVNWDSVTQVALKKGNLFKRAKLYIPEMGMAGGGDTLGVLKNAPHKAAAILLVSYLSDKDQQKKLNLRAGEYPARIDVPIEEALFTEEERQKNGLAWIPAPYKKHFIAEFVKNVLMK